MQTQCVNRIINENTLSIDRNTTHYPTVGTSGFPKVEFSSTTRQMFKSKQKLNELMLLSSLIRKVTKRLRLSSKVEQLQQRQQQRRQLLAAVAVRVTSAGKRRTKKRIRRGKRKRKATVDRVLHYHIAKK